MAIGRTLRCWDDPRTTAKIKQSSLAGTNFTAAIDSFSGHPYRLPRSMSLTSDNLTNIGAPQRGDTGSTLTFNNPSAEPTQCFYRMVVNP